MSGNAVKELQETLATVDPQQAALLLGLLKQVQATVSQPAPQVSQPQQPAQATEKPEAIAVALPKPKPKPKRDGPSKKINVQIEDRKHTGVTLPLTVWPKSTTIRDLKEQVSEEWNFPTNVQRWLIDYMLPRDDTTLVDCGIGRGGGDPPIFLYLLSARTAAMREKQDRRRSDQGQKTPSREGKKKPALGQEHRESENKAILKERIVVGWTCTNCTFVNPPMRPGCEVCAHDRPDDYKLPEGYQPTDRERNIQEGFELGDHLLIQALEEEKKENKKKAEVNYEQHIKAFVKNVIRAEEEVECAICFDTFPPGEAVVLRECLHKFCKECLAGQIEHCQDAVVKCPYNDEFNCEAEITEQEIKELVSEEIFEKYLRRGVQQAENQEPNSYHCKTPDCPGWCVYEDEVNMFPCPRCKKTNCLTCKAIHEGQNCQEYQDDIKRKAVNDEAARQTQEMLQRMVTNKEAMECPGCKVIVQKKSGCDWMQCTMCKMELCWATMGPRWGPRGRGDTSGGCKCGGYRNPCHPKCGNCH